jgi:hypothetical protein
MAFRGLGVGEGEDQSSADHPPRQGGEKDLFQNAALALSCGARGWRTPDQAGDETAGQTIEPQHYISLINAA